MNPAKADQGVPRIGLGLLLLVVLVVAILLLRADARAARLLVNTCLLAAGACAIALPIGTFLAVIITKTNTPGRRLAGAILFAMLFVPLYLHGGAWDAGFGLQGWFTLANNPNLLQEPLLSGWRAAIFIHGMAAVPWVVMIVGAGLRGVAAELEEDALLDASPLAVLAAVSLRRAAFAVLVAAMWVAVVCGTEIAVTDLFQVRTFAEEVYTQAALGTLDWSGDSGAENAGVAAAGGSAADQSAALPVDAALNLAAAEGPPFPAAGLWLGLALMTLVGILMLAIASRWRSFVADRGARSAWIWHLDMGRWLSALLLWLLVLLVAGVPLANFIQKAGIRVTVTDTGRERSWSAGKVLEQMATAPQEHHRELQLSAGIGAAAATAAVALALPLAWWLRRRRLGWNSFSWGIFAWLAFCLTVPGPILGLFVIHVLNRPPDSLFRWFTWLYDDTLAAPLIVQSIRAMPIATLIVWMAWSSFPQATLDAAASEGAGPWRQMAWIALPARWPAISAAWLIAFAVAFGELSATILAMPPWHSTTLPIRIFTLLHYGVEDRVASICLVLVLTLAALTTAASWFLRRVEAAS